MCVYAEREGVYCHLAGAVYNTPIWCIPATKHAHFIRCNLRQHNSKADTHVRYVLLHCG